MLQRLVPFGGLILFLVLFLAVVRNQRVPYPIRFNALQAILIDIVLVLVSLAFQLVLAPLGAGFVIRTLSNTIFLGAMLLILFAVIQCLRGKEADIPTLSEAVRMQLY
jgi:uncharacterized membrane protein